MDDNRDDDVLQRSESHEASPLGGLQFSLTSFFGITVVVALILAVFLGIGRAIGMETMEIVTGWMLRFLYQMPYMIVWIIGIVWASRCRKHNPLVATLTSISFAGFLLVTCLGQLAYMILIRVGGFMSWGLVVVGLIQMVLTTGCWILILIALFARRPADLPRAGRYVPVDSSIPPIADPFADRVEQ